MRVFPFGSTIKKTLFGVWRALRLDDEGRAEVVTPSGDAIDVDLHAVARESLPVATAEGSRVAMIADVWGREWSATDDLAAVAGRTLNLNPDSDKGSGYTIIDDTTGITDGTYPFYIPMDGFRTIAFGVTLDGGGAGVASGATVKFYATEQRGVAASAADYNDITEDLTGETSLNAAPTENKSWRVADNEGVTKDATFIMVELVCAGGVGDDCEATIHQNRGA